MQVKYQEVFQEHLQYYQQNEALLDTVISQAWHTPEELNQSFLDFSVLANLFSQVLMNDLELSIDKAEAMILQTALTTNEIPIKTCYFYPLFADFIFQTLQIPAPQYFLLAVLANQSVSKRNL